MDGVTIEQRYMSATKGYLRFSGILPDQDTFSLCIARLIFYCSTMPCIFTQIASMVCFFNLDNVIEGFPYLSSMTLSLIKQIVYVINEDKLKRLLDGMIDDWIMNKLRDDLTIDEGIKYDVVFEPTSMDSLVNGGKNNEKLSNRPKEEIDIMKVYAEKGALYRKVYVVNMYSVVSFFVLLPFVPRIMDKVEPLNVSRDLAFIYPAYYFVDDNEYYYPILAHMMISTLLVLVVFNACDSCYLIIVQHACGLLAVSGYRFRHAANKSFDDEKTNKRIVRNKIYRRIVNSIKAYKRAIEYIRDIEDTNHGYLLIVMFMVCMTFSFTLVKTATMKPCMEYYKLLGFLASQLIHMFFLTIQGQLIENTHDEVFDAIYDGLWYNCDHKTQTLFIFALRRCLTPPKLTAGGVVELNMQCFSGIIKTSMSYYTVFKSNVST